MKEMAMELEGIRKYTKQPWANNNQHQDEEQALMSRDAEESSDLYAVLIDTYSSTGDFSRQDSVDTKNLLFTANAPRCSNWV